MMKKKLLYIPVLLLALSVAACQDGPLDDGGDPYTPEQKDTTIVTPPEPVDETAHTDHNIIKIFWKPDFAYEDISSVADLEFARYCVNGEYMATVDPSQKGGGNDYRYEFHGKESMRFVSASDGYAITVPKDNGLSVDYTLGAYGMKFNYESACLRVTLETVKPYSQDEHGYGIYTGEWLDRYISNGRFISTNNLQYYESPICNDETLIEGYDVTIYSILVKDAKYLDYPYYKIAIIRKTGQWARFGLLVYKSAERENRRFEEMVKSFRQLSSRTGTPKVFVPEHKCLPDPDWNAATAAYYDKLLNQKHFDFGVFSYSMSDSGSDDFEYQRERIRAEKERLESEEGIGCTYGIMPTYSHLAWYDRKHYFPTEMAEEFAGGDGFNGKPVLQFTYQFTTNNNNVGGLSTPMFDILRGEWDEYFVGLAKDIKAYGKPVLFRLNNEMNTDWTSYCGMVTLLDPDIFIATWRHLYRIFKDNGVDNCIWIFNPIAVSCPYSNWGENLPYYPGNEYVQALGLTNYEMGNSLPMESFHSRYTLVWNTNKAIFGSIPWIISEFACGSGGGTTGEPKRNAHQQAEWVRGMFNDFAAYDSNPYLHNIKGAVWFSCNDWSGDQVTNYLALDSDLTETLAAFREGFSKLQ